MPRGGGWFAGGAIGMVAVGLMHASAHLQPPPPGPEVARAAMSAFTVTALGLIWSVSDAYDALSLSYAALSIFVGALDLYVLRALRPGPAQLRALALANTLGVAVIVAIAGAFRVAPPPVFYALVTASFAIAALRARNDFESTT